MPSRSGEQVSKPMDDSQFSGISFAVDSEFANEGCLSCFLSAAARKACSLSVHAPYGITLHSFNLGGKSHVGSKRNNGSQRNTRMGRSSRRPSRESQGYPR